MHSYDEIAIMGYDGFFPRRRPKLLCHLVTDIPSQSSETLQRSYISPPSGQMVAPDASRLQPVPVTSSIVHDNDQTSLFRLHLVAPQKQYHGWVSLNSLLTLHSITTQNRRVGNRVPFCTVSANVQTLIARDCRIHPCHKLISTCCKIIL